MKRMVPATRTLSAGVDWRQWAASSPPGSELNRRLAELLAVSDLPIEHYREHGALVATAELPGLDPERDVEITVSEGT